MKRLLFQILCTCLCKDIKVKPKKMQATLLIHLIRKKKEKKFFCQAEKTKQYPMKKILRCLLCVK